MSSAAGQTTPFDTIFSEIEGGLQARLYYLSVAVALSLPDICGALETNGYALASKYKKWFNENASHAFKILTAEDCYQLRNGVLHLGALDHDGQKAYDRVIFMLPGQLRIREMVVDRPFRHKLLHLDAEMFCETIISCVRAWYHVKQTDPNVITNIPNLVRFRPNGFPPEIVGDIPLIA